MRGPTRLLFIYASQDEAFRHELEAHLSSLIGEGLVEARHAGWVLAGTDTNEALADEVAQAGVVLLLLSADFLASEACGSALMHVKAQRAVRDLLVVPILVRPVDFRSTGLGDHRSLPRNGQAVTLWQNRDAAWFDVVEGLRARLTDAPWKEASREIIDFGGERLRHVNFFGRQGPGTRRSRCGAWNARASYPLSQVIQTVCVPAV